MKNTSSMYLCVKLNWDANCFSPAESKACKELFPLNVAGFELLLFEFHDDYDFLVLELLSLVYNGFVLLSS